MRTREEIQEMITKLESEKNDPKEYSVLKTTKIFRQIDALKWAIGELEEL